MYLHSSLVDIIFFLCQFVSLCRTDTLGGCSSVGSVTEYQTVHLAVLEPHAKHRGKTIVDEMPDGVEAYVCTSMYKYNTEVISFNFFFNE